MLPQQIPQQILSAASSRARLDHERLLSLINSMADAVIAVDGRARISIYNGAALNILDVNNLKAGMSLGDIMQLTDKNNKPLDVVELISNSAQAMSSSDYHLQYADGSSINLYLSIAPVHYSFASRGQRGYVLLMRDITHEKSLEEERDEFISVVSHELRTPIAISEGNISNAQLIAEKSGDITLIRKALDEAHNQIVFLSDMINDLSTLSRAERGKLTVDVEPINVHDFVTELASNYKGDAEKKGLAVHATIDPKLEVLYSSKLYVREILQNFITNAIKYTEKGHIEIGAKRKKDGVEFRVADTGIGLSKLDQLRVYDKFFRSEDFRTRATNGTGLGLYVTMKLARLLHTDISLTSELNKGSTFTIFIPNLSEPT
jgi:two-component system phosphate regulon sensor histidine kinase PhoR